MDDILQSSMETSSFSGSGVEEDNISLTCAQAALENLNGSVLPTPVDITVRSILAILSSVQVFLGLFLNSLVLLLVYKFRKLRTTSFAIAVQIALIDLTLAWIRGLPNVINQIAGGWVFGLHLCLLLGFVVFSLGTIRTNLILAFSVDRFTSVFMPFFYPKHNRKIVALLCVLAWSANLIYHSVGLLPVMDCYSYSEPLYFCPLVPSCSTNCQVYFAFGVVTVNVPPIIISTVLSIILYIKGRKIRKIESSMTGQDKKIISNQEWRAMKTFFLLFIAVFVVSIVPIIFYNVAQYSEKITSSLLTKLTGAFVLTIIIADPIIIMRNADVRESLDVLKNQLKNKFHKVFNGKEKD